MNGDTFPTNPDRNPPFVALEVRFIRVVPDGIEVTEQFVVNLGQNVVEVQDRFEPAIVLAAGACRETGERLLLGCRFSLSRRLVSCRTQIELSRRRNPDGVDSRLVLAGQGDRRGNPLIGIVHPVGDQDDRLPISRGRMASHFGDERIGGSIDRRFAEMSAGRAECLQGLAPIGGEVLKGHQLVRESENPDSSELMHVVEERLRREDLLGTRGKRTPTHVQEESQPQWSGVAGLLPRLFEEGDLLVPPVLGDLKIVGLEIVHELASFIPNRKAERDEVDLDANRLQLRFFSRRRLALLLLGRILSLQSDGSERGQQEDQEPQPTGGRRAACRIPHQSDLDLTRSRNSIRERWSSRNFPSIAEVIILLFRF